MFGVASLVLALLCLVVCEYDNLIPVSLTSGDGLGLLGPLITAALLSALFLLMHMILTLVLRGRLSLMVYVLIGWGFIAAWCIMRAR